MSFYALLARPRQSHADAADFLPLALRSRLTDPLAHALHHDVQQDIGVAYATGANHLS
jgi:hypothetical protein